MHMHKGGRHWRLYMFGMCRVSLDVSMTLNVPAIVTLLFWWCSSSTVQSALLYLHVKHYAQQVAQ